MAIKIALAGNPKCGKTWKKRKAASRGTRM